MYGAIPKALGALAGHAFAVGCFSGLQILLLEVSSRRFSEIVGKDAFAAIELTAKASTKGAAAEGVRMNEGH